MVDDGEALGDSDTIIAYLIRRYGLTIDASLSATQRDTAHLIGRMLDDLYWVMSYSRWKDGIGRFAPTAAYARGFADTAIHRLVGSDPLVPER